MSGNGAVAAASHGEGGSGTGHTGRAGSGSAPVQSSSATASNGTAPGEVADVVAAVAEAAVAMRVSPEASTTSTEPARSARAGGDPDGRGSSTSSGSNHEVRPSSPTVRCSRPRLT